MISNVYASNLARLVNLEEWRLYRMKSHDCHVFIQILIPTTYKDLCLRGIYDALT
jgi:hypothetical protein